MNEEDAARLAEECGGEHASGDLFYMTTTQLASFADSVQLDEREACAEMCDPVINNPNAYDKGIYHALRGCAAAIRSRRT